MEHKALNAAATDPEQSRKASLLCLILAMAAVALMYNGPLWQPYLFADEMNVLDPELSRSAYSDDLWTSIYFWTKIAVRPVSALVIVMFQDAFQSGESGLLMFRAIAMLASLSGLAAAFYLLRVLRVPAVHAALLLVFIWSQPAFTVHHAYLLLLPYWIGMYCAFASFALFHARRDMPLGRNEAVLHVILFGIALLTFQITPFVVLPFLALMALADASGQYTRRIALLFGTFLGTVAVYTVCFKLGSMVSGLGSYRRARELMTPGTLDEFVGNGYLRIFEFWNYPFPLRLEAAQKDMLNLAVVAVFVGLGLAAVLMEVRASRPVMRRWGLVIALFAASLLPIVAENGGDRQHMAVPAVMMWVLIFYSAAMIVKGPRRPASPLPFYAAVLVVAVVALGAALGLGRAIIGPYGSYLQDAQNSFLTQDASQGPSTVTVFLPPESVYDTSCLAEPCTGFLGRRIPKSGYTKRAGFYTFAAVSAGRPAEMTLTFLEPEAPRAQTAGEVTIDWAGLIARARQ